MSGESKMFEADAGLMNYRHDSCMSGESKMFEIETGLMNYWHDSCMSGESKVLDTETGLMNYQHACSCWMEVKCQRRQVLQIIDMIGACQVKVNV